MTYLSETFGGELCKERIEQVWNYMGGTQKAEIR